MQRRVLEYVPSLYKIFDEILVNAADHLIREPSMNALKVDMTARPNEGLPEVDGAISIILIEECYSFGSPDSMGECQNLIRVTK